MSGLVYSRLVAEHDDGTRIPLGGDNAYTPDRSGRWRIVIEMLPEPQAAGA